MLTVNQHSVNCDIRNCRNKAEYILQTKGRMGKFYICKECMDILARDYYKLTTPKSPKNFIKKVLDDSTIKEA